MGNISNEQLNITLARLIPILQNYGDPYTTYFELLYLYGLRPGEVRACKDWDFEEVSGIKVYLLKKQDFRILHMEEQEKEEIYNSLDNFEFLKFVNQGTANNIQDRYLNVKFRLSTGKNLGNYTYRHNYIKKLYDAGMSAADIAELIGEQSVLNIYGYINSDITAF